VKDEGNEGNFSYLSWRAAVGRFGKILVYIDGELRQGFVNEKERI
jgi:hypothetical protein